MGSDFAHLLCPVADKVIISWLGSSNLIFQLLEINIIYFLVTAQKMHEISIGGTTKLLFLLVNQMNTIKINTLSENLKTYL